MRGNWGLSLGLEELSLSHNSVDQETSNLFCEWLNLQKGHSKLKRIAIANMNIEMKVLPIDPSL
jgi:hypothetical protein